MVDALRSEVAAWAADVAVPLSSPEAHVAAPVLADFLRGFPDVRIVGAGESTHGTREFFQLKHGLARALSSTRLDAVLFEANLPDALDVDGWVRTGTGAASESLAGMGFWTWDTEEVADLLHWMRRSDSAARFLGVDLQSPSRSVQRLEPLLTADDWASVAGELADLARPTFGLVAPRDPQVMDRLEAALARLHGGFVRPAAAERAVEADMLLAHLTAWLRFSRCADIWDARRCRDAEMASLSTQWTSSLRAGARTLLWAHNQHVGRDGFDGRFPSMGGHLASRWGHEYLPIGLVFGSGSFQAVGSDDELTDHAVGEPGPELVESVLMEVPHDVYALDLRTAPPEARSWFAQHHQMRSIGSGFRDDAEHRLHLDPTGQYDALLVVRHATAARRTPSGRRGPRTSAAAVPPGEPLLNEIDLGREPRGWTLMRADDGLPWRLVVVRGSSELALLVVRGSTGYDRAGIAVTRRLDAATVAGRKVRWTARTSIDEAATTDAVLFAVAVTADGHETTMISDPAPTQAQAEILVPADAVDVRIGVRIAGTDPVLVDRMSLRIS